MLLCLTSVGEVLVKKNYRALFTRFGELSGNHCSLYECEKISGLSGHELNVKVTFM